MRSEPAVRVDRALGLSEEVAFFGAESPPMFGCVHLPKGKAAGGLVICSPIQAELFRSYRKEVLLARELAARGIAVQRFHYRGVGNSEGDGNDVTLETMSTASREARQALAERSGVERIATMGTRLGAFPAIATGRDDERSPLVLWDPVPDGDAYMEEILRNLYMHEVVSSHSVAPSERERAQPTQAMLDRMETDGVLHALGYRLTRSFYRSLSGRRLLDDAPKGPVLLVSFGGNQQARLIEAWTEAEVDLTVKRAPKAAWWLIGEEFDSEDSQQALKDLIGTTADWLVARLGQ